jgi:RHS repeat-associated protein
MRHIFTCFLTIILFITCFGVSFSQTTVPGDTSGYTAGAFRVTDGGAATYGFPIVISPGTAGLQPGISFSYNSQGGNGLMGLGWSMEGLSSISRAAQTKAQDGQVKGISFTATDRFALDGERLVLTDPAYTYGANGVEYRTEQNAIFRITSFGTGTAPSYFRVENKAGLIMEYGNSTDSKVLVNSTYTLHWLLNKITDRYGNYIQFSYSQNPVSGEYYPLEVKYTGNINTGLLPYASIKFDYESRSDSVQRYLNGFKIVNSTKRLKAVKAYYGNTLYRSYTFTYQYSPANLSELVSYKECGKNGSCNTPTNFTWTNIGTLNFSTVNISNIQQGAAQNKIMHTDINPDAVQDILKVMPGGNLEAYVSNKSATALAFTNTVINPPIQVMSKIILCDPNGDARQDFLLYDSITGANRICINTTVTGNNQISNNPTSSPIPPSLLANNKQIVAIDINNDGRTDFLIYDPATGTNYWLFSKSVGNAGISFEPNGALNYFTNLLPVSVFSGGNQPYLSDMNGDGLTDVFTYNPVNGNTAIYQTLGGTVVSFQQVAANIITPGQLTNIGSRLTLTDVNGDELPDILYYVKATGVNSWWINKGNYSFQSQVPSPGNLSTLIRNGDELMQPDFNQDGFADLLWTDKATGTNRWFVNDGKLNFTQLAGNLIVPADLAGYEVEGIGNFTSRSSFDIFLFNNNLTPRTKILKGNTGTNNLITKIVGGNGETTEVTYDFLTVDSLYTKLDNSIYPQIDYQATQMAVKSYQTSNGIGGVNKVTYRYKGAKIDVNGRGFRGFTEIEEKDETTGITETRTYLSDSISWKYINAPLVSQVTRQADGTVISRTDVINSLKTYFGGKCFLSFAAKTSTKNYEINGTLTDSSVVTQEYDDYGNVTATVTDYGNGRRDSLVNVIYNYPANWILGRLALSRLYRIEGTQPVIIKASAFQYDAATGSLTKEITEPDSSNIVKVTKSYQRDAYGNITRDTLTAWNGSALEKRITASTYDAEGRFPVSVTNPIGHTSTAIYDPILGHKLSEKDPNNLTTQYLRDNMGRLIKTINPDVTWTALDYRKCGSVQVCPPNASHLIYQQSSNTPPVITWYDLLNRVIRVQSTGFNGTAVYSDKYYNSRGLLVQETEPYYAGNSGNITYTNYDAIGRPIRVVRPGNRIDSIIYNGLTTTMVNALGQRNTIIKDVKGNIVLSRDNMNNDLQYNYDAAGRLTKTTDPLGNTINWGYDIRNNVIKEDDPDRGITNTVYNGFGELISSTRGGNTTTYSYDLLGRLKQRNEPEGSTKYYYDGQPRGLGILDSIISYTNTKETFARDTLGRVITHTKRIEGRNYTETYAYDNLGRLKTATTPTGFSKTIMYNAYGYLYQVKNTNTGVVYYSANIVNAKGQVEQVLNGNGTQVNKTYDALTNFLTAINTKKGSNFLQNMQFGYDATGNLKQRKDLLQNKQEDFELDALNRLTKAKVLGMDSVLMQYNSIGNVLSKSDVGAYTYGGPNNGPHRVVAVSGPNASCVQSLLVNTLYNSFDKVREITKDSLRLTIQYDAQHQRNVQKLYDSSRLVRTKLYIFPDFEREIIPGDTITNHFIQGPDGTVATYTTHSAAGRPAATIYYHRDHLGSAVMITSDTGAVIARYSFDAWGKRRNGNWGSTLTDTAKLSVDRGFTGHEHYDIFELVDMNGRIYDPVLGRFTSADPIIQDMTNLQALNRYSYCVNNPLSYTDPSGYSFFSKIKKAIKNVVKSAVNWVKDNWKILVTTAVAIVVGTLTAGTGYVAMALSGAASGFASNVTSTLLAGGNLGDALKAGIKGAVIGGISAVLTYGVGQNTYDRLGNSHVTDGSNVFQKSIAHGVIQGTSSVASGGSFISGFLSGAASTGSELGTNHITSYYGRLTAAAVVGGTTSTLSGGNFANGAVNAAFVQMYNAEAETGRRAAKEYLGKFSYGTVGFVVSEGLSLVYPLVGNSFSADIGAFYKAHESYLLLPATSQNIRNMMVLETNYWNNQTGIAGWLGRRLDADDRTFFLNKINNVNHAVVGVITFTITTLVKYVP